MLSHSLLSNGGNHADDREENDFYATEPAAADLLVAAKKRYGFNFSFGIWECACGEGHLSKRFDQLCYHVFSSDKIDRNYGYIFDFAFSKPYVVRQKLLDAGCRDIVTNPPYKLTDRVIENGFAAINAGGRLCLFLKLTFLESAGRDYLFNHYPVSRIHVCRKRIKCAKNGDFSKVSSSPTCYAWFVWEKGYTGPTIIDRI